MTKELAYKQGDNNYYVINPSWFKVFMVLAVCLMVLIIMLFAIVVYGIMWIDELEIVGRLFALVESGL